jgi:hypothetical protein
MRCQPETGVWYTFCELTARLRFAKSDCGSTVPKKIDLYWFIPAFANKRVGSECGTTGEDFTIERLSLEKKNGRGYGGARYQRCVHAA